MTPDDSVATHAAYAWPNPAWVASPPAADPPYDLDLDVSLAHRHFKYAIRSSSSASVSAPAPVTLSGS